MRIELTYPVWKTDVLAVELHPQIASSFNESGKIFILVNYPDSKKSRLAVRLHGPNVITCVMLPY